MMKPKLNLTFLLDALRYWLSNDYKTWSCWLKKSITLGIRKKTGLRGTVSKYHPRALYKT